MSLVARQMTLKYDFAPTGRAASEGQRQKAPGSYLSALIIPQKAGTGRNSRHMLFELSLKLTVTFKGLAVLSTCHFYVGELTIGFSLS